jgi:protein-glutamine gamma-glutamyltransferase
MIIVAVEPLSMENVTGLYPQGSLEDKMLRILDSSETNYRYRSMEELKFELDMRKSIVNASRMLYRSRIRFTIFDESFCNPEYWERTDDGGFITRSGVNPSSAINDIFRHGPMYGTECATAIVIVFYKAALDVLHKELFNRIFPVIRLMNWQDIDSDLGIKYDRYAKDILPGDCIYFKNPDVDPLTPEWQGENAIDLGNGTYYGHGIGITTAEVFIRELNRHRISGSEISAYLMDGATRPDFKHMASLSQSFVP